MLTVILKWGNLHKEYFLCVFYVNATISVSKLLNAGLLIECLSIFKYVIVGKLR